MTTAKGAQVALNPQHVIAVAWDEKNSATIVTMVGELQYSFDKPFAAVLDQLEN